MVSSSCSLSLTLLSCIRLLPYGRWTSACAPTMKACRHVTSCAGPTSYLRDVWEATGFQLERLQANEVTVAAEQAGLKHRQAPRWHIPFTPMFAGPQILNAANKPAVAIIR